MATPQEMREYLGEHCQSDLMFIWTEAEVDLPLQYAMAVAGFCTLRKYVGLEDSKPLVRAALVADFGLNVAAGPPAGARARLQLAAGVSAWDIACQQQAREVQIRSEAKALNITRPIGVQERGAMKRACVAIHGSIPSFETPSADYIAVKMEELEHNEPTASQLDEVTSEEDGEAQSLTASLDMTGKVQVIRKRSKVSVPTGPEEFRARLRIEKNLWLFLGLKFINRGWLQGLTPQHWETYTDFFLGSRANTLKIPVGNTGTSTSLNPPWGIVLAYEFQCRKAAFKAVREDGETLAAALQTVVRDAELKELYFTSPIALMGRKQNSHGAFDETPPWERKTKAKNNHQGKSGGKGAGKGAGKSSGKGASKGNGKGGGKGTKGSKKNLLFVTPDGRQICFAFNSHGCTDSACERVHVCRVRGCMGAHSMAECTKTVQ